MHKKSFTIFLILCFILAPLFTSCKAEEQKRAKYIFLFIGDGMSLSQVHLTQLYLQGKEIPETNPEHLCFTDFPALGLTTTHSSNSWITDSAAAGTAIACGQKTVQKALGVDKTKNIALRSVAFSARDEGMKTGIITSVSIDHATPAAFYAHQDSRKYYWEILKELPKSKFNFFAAGGFKSPDKKSKDGLSKNEFIKKSGYRITRGKDELLKLTKGDDKILAFAKQNTSQGDLPNEIDRKDNEIALADFTSKAIELLDNPKGFFIMVEGGKIDWSEHANDTATMFQEAIAFNKSIEKALEFYKKHPEETLIVITGDHETGGLTIGRGETGYDLDLEILKNQKISTEKFAVMMKKFKEDKGDKKVEFKEIVPLLNKYFGFKWKGINDDAPGFFLNDEEIKKIQTGFEKFFGDGAGKASLYSWDDPVTLAAKKLINLRAGVGNSSGTHTGVPVVTFAIGVNSELFKGYYDNTDIYKKLMKSAQYKD